MVVIVIVMDNIDTVLFNRFHYTNTNSNWWEDFTNNRRFNSPQLPIIITIKIIADFFIRIVIQLIYRVFSLEC